MTEEQIINELGISGLPQEIQEKILDEYNYQVGAVFEGELSEEKLEQYMAIINGDQTVIDEWLKTNAPNYASTDAYKQLSQGVEDDPERVPADKAFASMAWVQTNTPDNFQEKVDAIKERFKTDIAQYQ